MASKTDQDNRSVRKIDKQLDNLGDSMTKLYQTTYQSRMDNKSDMESIMGSIDDTMDSIYSKINNKSISDISSLLLRVQGKNGNGTDDISDSLENFFDDNKNLLDTINMDNIRKSIQAEDYQYDLICRYMTKLEDALEIKKDNVLSSDNFTKEFVNIVSNRSNQDYIKQFGDKYNKIKEKYEIQDLFEDMYYKTSKYGEYFLYLVPYKKAFERLLKRKNTLGDAGAQYESGSIYTNTSNKITIVEASTFDGNIGENQTLSKSFVSSLKEGNAEVNIIFDESGIIPEPIIQAKESADVSSKYTSVTESYFTEADSGSGMDASMATHPLRMDSNSLANDGIIDSKTGRSIKIKQINGAVLYEIPRDEIFPIAMQRTVIGYIHMKIANNYIDELVMNGYSYNSLTNNTNMQADEYDKQNDNFVSYISSQIAEKIDAKFINSNIDLKEQIFSILRYNDHFCSTNGVNNIIITFIPAQDIHHFYFKLDERTHRGISDLNKAVVPAMIYCMLYLNSAIGQLSRAQDKRVYYVKQNVETNVAKTLLNVVNQIKKGNMGMRQLENMNTIFNVIGKFNDYIIPISQAGDPPIDMQVMQGQQIDTPTDLMNEMQDAAISTTDVPLEFVQSTQNVDYATRFTMSNSKFLRKVYTRQRICQNKYTPIFRDIYNYEYEENDQTLKVMLPAPAFLAMTNSQQLVNNVKDYVNSIADLVLTDKEDQDADAVRGEFVNIMIRNYLGTYIDFELIDDTIASAKNAVQLKKDKTPDEDAGGGEY